MRDPHDVIIRPVLTEKSYDQIADRKYTFIVDINSNKTEIKNAVEKLFGVKVESVNTLRQKGKLKRMGANVGRRPERKKAIVKLAEGSKSIEFFEGL
ncbi:MAG TPA: 50S ribosomal protein L23 [Clostridiales bacterium]|jgi:large subunit ribosomal protein L23|nr:50S ribosomal protein L23 [Clostridiales bacterium]